MKNMYTKIIIWIAGIFFIAWVIFPLSKHYISKVISKLKSKPKVLPPNYNFEKYKPRAYGWQLSEKLITIEINGKQKGYLFIIDNQEDNNYIVTCKKFPDLKGFATDEEDYAVENLKEKIKKRLERKELVISNPSPFDFLYNHIKLFECATTHITRLICINCGAAKHLHYIASYEQVKQQMKINDVIEFNNKHQYCHNPVKNEPTELPKWGVGELSY